MKSKICPQGKILNPKTNRCVLITGKIGQQLLKTTANPKDAKKVANKIKTMIDKNYKKRILKIKNFTGDDNDTFDDDLVQQLDKSAKIISRNINSFDNTARLLISYKRNYITVVFYGITNEKNETIFRLSIFKDKNEAIDYFNYDEYE
jgi:hypothetical protein